MMPMEESKNFPTMIIPHGTEVSVNEQGQLSIKTPGNLVIQNSGVYSVIESGSGSVRIDPNVQVEAISVELTAWRVHADKIILEKGAQANIMLQESETLELDRNARLVGNFASEKELYLMLGRFSRQLRDLPEGVFSSPQKATFKTSEPALAEAAPRTGAGADSGPQQRQEMMSLVKVIVERELAGATGGAGQQALEELLGLVRSGNTEVLGASYAQLIDAVAKPSSDLQKARAMLDRFFR
jgi:hypothetical protein